MGIKKHKKNFSSIIERVVVDHYTAEIPGVNLAFMGLKKLTDVNKC